MIEYCLESVQCDPDVEIKLTKPSEIQQTSEEPSDDEEDESDHGTESQSNEINEPMDIPLNDEETKTKPKETSIFSLLRTVSFADNSIEHPLKSFLKKSKNLNVLHHETYRTPLLQAIHLQQHKTAHMLIKESSCDVNLATSILEKERQQTPLIFACRLQTLSIIQDLLNHKQCNILAYDYQDNQAIHYYLSTSNRPNQYLDILNLFVEKIKSISNLNIQGKFQRTPLHIAIYHNPGTIDSTTDVEQTLIDNGCDLFIKDKSGNIPLHNVFINRNVGDDPVELFVLISKAMKNKGIDTENNDGNTPLHLAVVSNLNWRKLQAEVFAVSPERMIYFFSFRLNVRLFV